MTEACEYCPFLGIRRGRGGPDCRQFPAASFTGRGGDGRDRAARARIRPDRRDGFPPPLCRVACPSPDGPSRCLAARAGASKLRCGEARPVRRTRLAASAGDLRSTSSLRRRVTPGVRAHARGAARRQAAEPCRRGGARRPGGPTGGRGSGRACRAGSAPAGGDRSTLGDTGRRSHAPRSTRAGFLLVQSAGDGWRTRSAQTALRLSSSHGSGVQERRPVPEARSETSGERRAQDHHGGALTKSGRYSRCGRPPTPRRPNGARMMSQ